MAFQFQFDSLADFFAMGSYWPYVWSCYGMATTVVFSLIIIGQLRKRRFMRIQQGILKRSENHDDVNSTFK